MGLYSYVLLNVHLWQQLWPQHPQCLEPVAPFFSTAGLRPAPIGASTVTLWAYALNALVHKTH